MSHPRRTHSLLLDAFYQSTRNGSLLQRYCLKQLEKAIQQTKVERIRLVDYAGAQSTNHDPIPFDYQRTFRQHWNDPNGVGVDFGIVYVPTYYRRLLEANGVRANDEVQWRRQPERFETAWMLGFPSALVRRRDPSTYLFSVDDYVGHSHRDAGTVYQGFT